MILNYQGMGWNIAVVLSNSECDPELSNFQRQVIGNGEDKNIDLYQQLLSLGGHDSIARGKRLEFLSPAWRHAEIFY